MQCSDARLLLHAYLDNELDAGDSVRLMRHVADCPACSDELERQSRLKDLLQRARPQPAMPDAVRARILAALPLSASAPTDPATVAAEPTSTLAPTPLLLRPRRRMRTWTGLPVALAASLMLLLGGGGIGMAWQRHASESTALATDVLSNHLRSLQSQHLTDVLTSDQHTVKPWFDGKLEFSPQVRDLNAAGFVLVGGRLDVVHGRRVAAIVYRRRLHEINLFQWPDPAANSTPVSADASDGYTTLHWEQDGMAYWAVSSLNRAEMEEFAAAFRAAHGMYVPAAR
ncbi:MAG TPA: zf-HC2 domain-containing protein [Xanthomonadaceae bacterium]|nr:zf-HC2 domain-containing protein [Xanthomonadaceae bacterium]